jgi:hypothetical protein
VSAEIYTAVELVSAIDDLEALIVHTRIHGYSLLVLPYIPGVVMPCVALMQEYLDGIGLRTAVRMLECC